MNQERRLFDPGSIEELLRGWLLHAHKGRDRHDAAARRYEVRRLTIGVPALVLSTAVGTSVFTALGEQKSLALQITIGLLSVSAAVLAALQTFLDFPARVERHRMAAVKYKEAIRELEQVLSLLRAGTPPATETIDEIRRRLDVLEEQAPVVIERLHDRIEKRYADVTFVREALGLYR